MQTVTIDLNRSPDIKTALADCEPGEEVQLHGTIKSLDDQTCVVTVEEVSLPETKKEDDEEKKDEETAPGNEGSGEVGGMVDE